MFTTETGIGVVVMVVFAAIWLAFMLWEDWGQAGKTARARASAKANGWGFNIIPHLQRQNFHIKSANITTGMKIRFTISPASALLDGGFSSSSFAAR